MHCDGASIGETVDGSLRAKKMRTMRRSWSYEGRCSMKTPGSLCTAIGASVGKSINGSLHAKNVKTVGRPRSYEGWRSMKTVRRPAFYEDSEKAGVL